MPGSTTPCQRAAEFEEGNIIEGVTIANRKEANLETYPVV
jgi:hypothetical protein